MDRTNSSSEATSTGSDPIDITSSEPAILRDAEALAFLRSSATSPHHQIRIQDSIRWLAESGFARHSDGTLDAGCLADAAVTFGALAAAGSPRRVKADDAHWVV